MKTRFAAALLLGLLSTTRTIGSYAAGDKPRYQTDITEIVRRKELPEGVTR